MSVKATVTDFEFINPHVQIYLEAKNDKGENGKMDLRGEESYERCATAVGIRPRLPMTSSPPPVFALRTAQIFCG